MIWRDIVSETPGRDRRAGARAILAGLALAGALGIALPAVADVKAGVDAWTRGDYAGAIKEWQAAADRGDADGQFNLAQAYKLGRGVPQDLAKAEALYGKAAAQGHVQAADNYGLLLFQRGEHAAATSYIRAGADHGDPRAQYLLGIALFNGDGIPKDWVRAYALVSLAQQQGLSQAQVALGKLDQYIPLEQRQRAVSLASDMAAQAEANRTSQFAAMDLGTKLPATGARPVPTAPAAAPPRQMAPAPAPTRLASAAPYQAAPATTPAGADYTRAPMAAAPMPTRTLPPAPMPLPRPAYRPITAPYPVPAAPEPVAPAPRQRQAPVGVAAAVPSRKPVPVAAPVPASAGGSWRIQLGAFGVPANADALWSKVHARPELTGHARINLKSGAVTRLLAGGYSEEGARAACHKLSAAGMACIPVGD